MLSATTTMSAPWTRASTTAASTSEPGLRYHHSHQAHHHDHDHDHDSRPPPRRSARSMPSATTTTSAPWTRASTTSASTSATRPATRPPPRRSARSDASATTTMSAPWTRASTTVCVHKRNPACDTTTTTPQCVTDEPCATSYNVCTIEHVREQGLRAHAQPGLEHDHHDDPRLRQPQLFSATPQLIVLTWPALPRTATPTSAPMPRLRIAV
jgi:hypothetical protein